MLLSKRCLYGLRAVLYLVIQPEESGYISIKVIAEALGVPFHFLTKVLQDLTRAGMLVSSRGVAGGVKLAKPAGNLDVLQVIESLEGDAVFRGCILGLERCGGKNPCAIHDQWAALRHQMIKMFSSETLEEIAARIDETHLRQYEPCKF